MKVFFVTDNTLYRRRKNSWVELVTTPAQVRDILKFYHITSGCHVGIVKAKDRIAAKNGMSKDIYEYVSTLFFHATGGLGTVFVTCILIKLK